MKKIQAADELKRLAIAFKSLIEVADMLEKAGSMEQALEEAKSLREAEIAEFEKVKAETKAAKDELKKAKDAVKQAQFQATVAAEAAAEEQAREFKETAERYAKAIEEKQNEFDVLVAQIERKKQAAESEVMVAKSAKLKEVAELELKIDALNKKAAEADDKFTKAKKQLEKLGLKLEE